jgi:hypothetical protein
MYLKADEELALLRDDGREAVHVLLQVRDLLRRLDELKGGQLNKLSSRDWPAVLEIRDIYPGSEFFPSRIPDTHQRILTQKIVSKLSKI